MQRAERGWEKLNNAGTNYELWEPYLLIFNVQYSANKSFSKIFWVLIFFLDDLKSNL